MKLSGRRHSSPCCVSADQLQDAGHPPWSNPLALVQIQAINKEPQVFRLVCKSTSGANPYHRVNRRTRFFDVVTYTVIGLLFSKQPSPWQRAGTPQPWLKGLLRGGQVQGASSQGLTLDQQRPSSCGWLEDIWLRAHCAATVQQCAVAVTVHGLVPKSLPAVSNGVLA